MRIAFIIFLIFPVWLGAAQVYKSTAPDGTVIYSDQPTEDATPVDIEPAPAVPALPRRRESAPSPPPPAAESESSSAFQAYRSVQILSPTGDSVVRNNNGDVTLQVEVEPALQVEAGHRLAVALDGTLLEGRFTGDRLTLNNVDRGTHQVAVMVVDGQGKVLIRSTPLSFHMKRHSILNP
jgi:hypothetical protein